MGKRNYQFHTESGVSGKKFWATRQFGAHAKTAHDDYQLWPYLAPIIGTSLCILYLKTEHGFSLKFIGAIFAC